MKNNPLTPSSNIGNINVLEELQTQLLTREEVGRLFKVKPATVYMWERTDPMWIKPIRQGKYVGYRVEDVKAYIAGNAPTRDKK